MTDKGDPTIEFNSEGICNYCTEALEQYPSSYFPNEIGEERLKQIVKHLKEKNKDKPYDCLMGISGGLDSAYLAYKGGKEWGLRIVAVHIDDGFDTEITNQNIINLCDKCGVDLKVIKPDPKQYNELLRAYMLAGVPRLIVPQDNILFSAIYKFAKEHDIHDFLSGSNFSLECILQSGNTHNAYDLVNLKDIHKSFGREDIDKLPMMSSEDMEHNKMNLGIRTYSLLDYIPYVRREALRELADFCGYRYYGSKHLENYFTGFHQLYWLPKKFGVDKRTSHLSSMIVTNQITRQEALEEMRNLPCTEEWMENAISLVKSNLDLADDEFINIMQQPTHQHNFYRVTDVYQKDAKIRKLNLYYDLLNKWLYIKNCGECLEKFFKYKAYKTIAIYGIGNLGERFYEEMKNSQIEIKYIIDRDENKLFSGIPVVNWITDLEAVDVVVVTPISDYEKLDKQLNKVMKCAVISLMDIVNDDCFKNVGFDSPKRDFTNQ